LGNIRLVRLSDNRGQSILGPPLFLGNRKSLALRW